MILLICSSSPSYALHTSDLSVSTRTRMNVIPTSCRSSVVASPKAQSTPGDGGIITGKARSSFPREFAWRGPAPPNATRLKSLGSYPCSTETNRSAPYLKNLSLERKYYMQRQNFNLHSLVRDLQYCLCCFVETNAKVICNLLDCLLCSLHIKRKCSTQEILWEIA